MTATLDFHVVDGVKDDLADLIEDGLLKGPPPEQRLGGQLVVRGECVDLDLCDCDPLGERRSTEHPELALHTGEELTHVTWTIETLTVVVGPALDRPAGLNRVRVRVAWRYTDGSEA